MSKLFKYFGVIIKEGEYIFREGDEADCMYLIHRGRVKISKSRGNVEKRIQILEDGEFVGEMAIINSLPRSADALALEECELIRMDRASYSTTIEKNRQFALSFIQFLSKRLRDTTDQLTLLSEKERSRKVFVEIVKDMMIQGKQDKNGKWQLLKLQPFIERYNRTHLIDQEDIMAVLDELIHEDQIRLKTDQNQQTWIALPLAPVQDS